LPLRRRSITFAHPAYLYQVSSEDLDHLRSENAELRRRVEIVRAEIDQMRTESLQRRDEVRRLVADLPAVVSRRAVVRQMFGRGGRQRQITQSP
jgi:cell division protein FtsB